MKAHGSGRVRFAQLQVAGVVAGDLPRRYRRAFLPRFHIREYSRRIRSDHLDAVKTYLATALHFAEFNRRGRGKKFGMFAVPQKKFAAQYDGGAAARNQRAVRAWRTVKELGFGLDIWRGRGSAGRCSVRKLTPAFFRIFRIDKIYAAPPPQYSGDAEYEAKCYAELSARTFSRDCRGGDPPRVTAGA